MKYVLAVTLYFIITSSLSAQDKQFARSLVNTLASPSFAGRGYVEDGDRKAARFIAQKFDSLGLKKFEDDYLQPFNVDVNTIPKGLKIKIDKAELKPGIDYLADPASPKIRGKYVLQVVKDEDLKNPNKYLSSLKKSDKTFLVFPAEVTKNKQVQNLINFLKYEPTSPVGGIIQLTDSKLTWYGATSESARPLIIMKSNSYPQSAKKIRLFISSELKKDYETNNVIGYLPGQSDSTVVFTAHYDHLGKMGSKTYFPGANDNASGTAFLIDMARHYSQKDSLPYTMIFIAFGAEEIGLQGSQYYVDNPLSPLKKIKFLLNFDLAGTGDEGIQVVNGSIFLDRFELLKNINENYGFLPQVKIRGDACNSDHCPFYRKGVPSFFIYTLGGIKAYHDINDKASTLPLTEYEDYFTLINRFVSKL